MFQGWLRSYTDFQGMGLRLLVASQMQSSARDIGPSGFDIEYGYGLIQMDAALKLALPSTATPAQSSTAVIGSENLFFKPGAPTFAWNATDTPTPTAAPTDTPATFTPLPETPLPIDPTTPYELQALSISGRAHHPCAKFACVADPLRRRCLPNGRAAAFMDCQEKKIEFALLQGQRNQ